MEIAVIIGNNEIIIPDSIISLFIIAIALIVLGLVVRSKAREAKPDEVPTGLMNVMEMYVELVDGFVESTMGESNIAFAPYIFTLFTFLLVANLSGLVGLTPPTSDYSVTLALALVTFFLVQFFGIRTSGFGGYIKGFFQPLPLLAPLNIVGELANPVSLSFRLFGNILSGGLIMTLLHSFLGLLTPLIAPPFHIYFDMFSGVLQAFIFTMLTMVFISGAIND